jgi:hypothetical protein
MTQPEALRLADCLETEKVGVILCDSAAAELRRLHAVNAELLEALENLEKEFRKVYPSYYYLKFWGREINVSAEFRGHETNVPFQAARATIKKVKEV